MDQTLGSAKNVDRCKEWLTNEKGLSILHLAKATATKGELGSTSIHLLI